MDKIAAREKISDKNDVDHSTRNVRGKPADIFINGNEDFQILKISSSDDCSDDNVGDEVDDDDLSIEEVSNDDSTQLELSTWPASVKLVTDDNSVDFRNNDCDENDDADDSCKDTDKSCSDNNDINKTSNGKKKKKLSKIRKKKKNVIFYACKRCNVKFTSELDLNIHTYTTHNVNYSLYFNNNKFTCLLCRKTFANKCFLDAHVTKEHTEKKIINCVKCNKEYKYRSYLTRNISNNTTLKNTAHNHRESQRFTCFHCSLKR